MTGRASGLSNGLARMRLNRRELLKQFSAGSGLLSLTALLSRQGEMSAGAVALSSPIDGLTLAEAGKAIACIVVAKTADTAEQNAAAELAHYLRLITDVDFKIHTEDDLPKTGSRIYIGPTASAALHGIDWHSLSPEEWIVRTVGKDLLIIGGRPRGTSYGVYHFLEEILGVHWWNPFEESVPHRTNLRIDSLSMKGKPEFPYRDIYMLFGHDDGRFAARCRLNRDGDAAITERYGGSLNYGPPYHVHTFGAYFPPATYFSLHPEWYSLVNGKRIGTEAQLCLTNVELRKEFLKKLRTNIEASRTAARADGVSAPLVFSVSQNDCLNPCQCGPCQKIAIAEESECGPLLDFVNYLADAVKQQFPDVFIDTLAYQYTEKAPKTIRPRDNVIIRLCNTTSDQTQPITSNANAPFREQLLRWAKIAGKLRIWNYAVTYDAPVGLPMPTAQNYGPDYRFYAGRHVEGVFTELEFEILADMRDFKVWMMAKQLESPHRDYPTLMQTFTDGFYGPGGRHIRQYLIELQNAMEQEAGAHRLQGYWNVATFSYLKPPFVTRAHQLFDRAEQSVGNNAALLRRVRHARLPLDRASVHLHLRLVSQWQAAGRPVGQVPPDRTGAARRALDTWLVQAKLRLPLAAQEAERLRAIAELRRYATPADRAALPEKFRSLPEGSLYDYTAPMSRNADNTVRVVKDPEAETGVADKLDLTADYVESKDKYSLPMPWGLYGPAEKRYAGSSTIKSEDIPGRGYHWYKMGSFSLAPTFYLYFFWSWIIQFDIDNAYDPVNPDQKFDVWAYVKFTGPRFPHPRPDERDAIYVERVVLVKTGA